MISRHSILQEVEISGLGIHTGKKSKIKLIPVDDGGIVFFQNGKKITADCNNADADSRCMSLNGEQSRIMLVEHLLSALWMTGVSDVLIEVYGDELPSLDGSAMTYIENIKKAGIIDLGKIWERESFLHPVRVTDGNSELIYFPDSEDSLDITVYLSYEEPGLKCELFTVDAYDKNIIATLASARTFAFESWIDSLKDSGLIKGGTLENALVFGKDGRIINEDGLRFEKECSKHKVLDLLGDLMLYPRRLTGRLVSFYPGHLLNLKFLKILAKETQHV